MLTQREVEKLSERLEELSCIDPRASDGLFGFVLCGELGDRKLSFEQHIAECEYCRTAREIYRYKRDSARVFSKWQKATDIVTRAVDDPRILKRNIGNQTTAYFQPSQTPRRGVTVLVSASGDFLSVEEQSLEEFEQLKAG